MAAKHLAFFDIISNMWLCEMMRYGKFELLRLQKVHMCILIMKINTISYGKGNSKQYINDKECTGKIMPQQSGLRLVKLPLPCDQK